MSDQYDGASRQLVPGTLRGYRAWYMPEGFSLLNGESLMPLKSVSMHFTGHRAFRITQYALDREPWRSFINRFPPSNVDELLESAPSEELI